MHLHAAEDVVGDPRRREERDADRDCLRCGEVGDGRVDQVRVRVEVEEDDEEGEAGQPRRIRLPLEPGEVVGELLRRDLVLLDVVKAAAVYLEV